MTRSKLATGLALIGICAALQFGCSGKGTDGDPYFEIHEWGVLAGYKSDTTYQLTARPEGGSPPVREPVIYVHSDIYEPFNATVTFSAGEPLVTYPTAEVSGKTIHWDDVLRTGERPMPKLASPDDSLALEQVIQILGNVEATQLRYNEEPTRLLLYEGALPFANLVDVSYDLDSMTAQFTNNASYPVYDLILTIARGSGEGVPPSYVATLDQLAPGAADTRLVGSQAPVLTAGLVELGFDGTEAGAFNTLWANSILVPGDYGHTANLCYRLPQERYDQLVSLSIEPQPTGILRALFILVHYDPPAKHPGLHMVGNAYYGVGLNDCIKMAHRIAGEMSKS